MVYSTSVSCLATDAVSSPRKSAMLTFDTNRFWISGLPASSARVNASRFFSTVFWREASKRATRGAAAMRSNRVETRSIMVASLWKSNQHDSNHFFTKLTILY
eukprot:Lithocolla_globosa_v1_NODE_2952_length_1814_cov_4.807277.p3 type:complete len:103 gc:universal NODE_2952_length_1814_cov_4.807277:793-1101(+)